MKRSFVSLLSGFAFSHRYIFRFQVDSHMNGVVRLLLGHKKYRLDESDPAEHIQRDQI